MLSSLLSLKFDAKTSNILRNKKCIRHLYEIIVVVDNNKDENYKKVITSSNNLYSKFFDFEKDVILKDNNVFNNKENMFYRDYNWFN